MRLEGSADQAREGPEWVQQLTAQDRDEVGTLVAACKQRTGGLNLPLYLAPAGAVLDDETNHFFYYHDDVLVGAATLPPGAHTEAVGMVHPAYRRRGIGRALLRALVGECQRRGVPRLTLVCEEVAPSGGAFARAVGASYDYSEHRMVLDREAFARSPAPQKTLVLRRAAMQDVDALVALWTSYKDDSEDEARQAFVRQLQRANETVYVGRLEGELVGVLRVQRFEASAFLVSFRVHAEHRRRGYGRQILVEVLDRLVDEGWEQIVLEVATDNEAALSLYDSCGFYGTATFDYYDLSV